MSLRPGGVTGIAVLFLISAAGGIAAGILCLVASDFVATWWTANLTPIISDLPLIGNFYASNFADNFASTFWWTIGGVALLVIGIADLLTAVGLLKLQKWGYWLCFLISIPLIVAIIGIIFIWYLRKDEVKAAFDLM